MEINIFLKRLKINECIELNEVINLIKLLLPFGFEGYCRHQQTEYCRHIHLAKRDGCYTFCSIQRFHNQARYFAQIPIRQID